MTHIKPLELLVWIGRYHRRCLQTHWKISCYLWMGRSWM